VSPGAFSNVAAGEELTCGRVTDGELACWGAGGDGENPTHMDATTPQLLSSSMSYVFAGGNHACALDNQGTQHMAYCWGYNGEGQLGFPYNGLVDTPTVVPSHYWDTLSLGSLHTCGIETGSKHLYCWGDNRRGQIGNNDMQRASVDTPALVNGSTWRSVAAGAFHTCAVDTGSQLYCWGSDDDGALLDGNGWVASFMAVDVPP